LSGLIEVIGALIHSSLKREFEEEQVRVAYMGSPLKVFVEDDYVELVRGSEYTLPRWLALYLVEKNYARFAGEGVDVAKVSRLAFNESRSRSQLKFEKLEGYFYSLVKLEVEMMLKSHKSIDSVAKAQELLDRLNKLVTNTRNLYRYRLSKLMTLLTLQDAPPDVLANLSEEEKQLYEALKTLLEIFNARVFEVGGGGK